MSDQSTESQTFAVWPTAWGPVGAVAVGRRLSRFVLPHYQRADLIELLKWEHPEAVADESAFVELQDLTRGYFNGQGVCFDAVDCELPKTESFGGQVLRACRQIPFGQTLGYRQLALKLGREDAARAVAGALGKNAIPLIVPCHRVTYADGRPGGFSAAGGVDLKQRMLAMEAQAGALN